MIDIKQARILAAVGALVFSVPVQGIDPGEEGLTNHDKMVKRYADRFFEQVNAQSPLAWKTLREAKKRNFVDELVTQMFSGAPKYENALLLVLQKRLDFIGNPWDFFGADARVIAPMLTQRSANHRNMNAVGVALVKGYSDDDILELLRHAHNANVLDRVLLNQDDSMRTVLDIAIDEYRSKELIEGIINFAKGVNGLVPQLVNDQLVDKARDRESPAAEYLESVKREIDGIV